MNIYQIATPKNPKQMLKDLGVESGGVSIISHKMRLLFFQIKDLKTPAVNILKQDALSIGAELAVPSGVILCEQESYDAVLIGTLKQIKILSQKELSQPFGLKNIAIALQGFVKSVNAPRNHPKIMGVLNMNNDSFYAQSRFSSDKAIEAITQMIDDDVDIIDIGAVSSRPGSLPVSSEEELSRVKPICDLIASENLCKKIIFSIDSYSPIVIEYALKSGFKIINDISGASNDEVIKLAIKYNSKLCIMHMQGTPKDMQDNPQYDNVLVEVTQFFQERIDRCEQLGLDRENIILDVGIGFGKKLEHNLELIRNIEHFLVLGCKLLVGASRKSMINDISSSDVEHRLPGTLSIHLYAVEHGASIIRCHDVKEHSQALSVWNAI